jgi:hypothetical protein
MIAWLRSSRPGAVIVLPVFGINCTTGHPLPEASSLPSRRLNNVRPGYFILNKSQHPMTAVHCCKAKHQAYIFQPDIDATKHPTSKHQAQPKNLQLSENINEIHTLMRKNTSNQHRTYTPFNKLQPSPQEINFTQHNQHAAQDTFSLFKN